MHVADRAAVIACRWSVHGSARVLTSIRLRHFPFARVGGGRGCTEDFAVSLAPSLHRRGAARALQTEDAPNNWTSRDPSCTRRLPACGARGSVHGPPPRSGNRVILQMQRKECVRSSYMTGRAWDQCEPLPARRAKAHGKRSPRPSTFAKVTLVILGLSQIL